MTKEEFFKKAFEFNTRIEIAANALVDEITKNPFTLLMQEVEGMTLSNEIVNKERDALTSEFFVSNAMIEQFWNRHQQKLEKIAS